MAQDYSITYEKVKSYEFEEYGFEDWESWYNHTISQLNSLKKRNADGSEINVYGGITSRHDSLLKNSMKKRFENKDDASSPYHLFKDVVGEYLVKIEDMVTIKGQISKLEEMLEIFNGIKALTSADPSPQRKKTPTELPTGDEDLEAIALDISYGQIVSYGKEIPSFKSVMGAIMGKYPQYRSDPDEVESVADKMVEKANSDFTSLGIDEIRKMVTVESKEDKEVKPTKELNIEYYFAIGDYRPDKVYYEIDGEERQVGLPALIRKVKDKKLQDGLNRIKPDGPEWPESATGNYYLVISNDPMMVVTMSTSRPWANRSCMRAEGPFSEGPFHDVELGNPVTYVLTANETNEGWPTIYDDTLEGRNLMKWGLRDNKKGDYAIGFEPTTYPGGKDWGIPMATALGMILTDTGYLGYSKCTTPYRYKGWSDLMATNDIKIVFTGINLYGKNIDLNESQFAPEISMALSPMAVYSQMNRLTRLSVDIRIKRAVAQNPNIWMYEMALGRLIRTKDYDIYRQLVGSPIAIPEALNEMGQIIEQVDPQVTGKSWSGVQSNGLLMDFIKHPNTPPELHQFYVEQYGEPFISWAYHSIGTPGRYPQPCYAPHEIMGDVIEAAFNYPEREAVLRAVQSIIYAPNMNHDNFVALLSNFKTWMMRRKWHTKKGRASLSENHSDLFHQLEMVRSLFSYRVVFPFHEGDDGWAFKGDYIGLSTKTNDIRQGWRDKYENLMTEEIVSLLVRIVPEIMDESDMFNGCLLFENLREWLVGDFLWLNRTKLGISPKQFINRPRSQKDILVPTPHLLCSSDRVAEVFDELDDSEIDLFKYDFLPYDDEQRLERESVPRQLLQKILSDPEYILNIGSESVAMWLIDPTRHFDKYEDAIMKVALDGLWDEGNLLEPPEDYFEFYQMIKNIGVMEEAAIGLAKNPRISEDMQHKLLNTWLEISIKYEGAYSGMITDIEDLLVSNPSISREIVERLIHNVNYKQALAKNPGCPQSYLTGHRGGGREASLFYQYPVEVLSNPGLSDENFSRLWTLMDSYLRTEVEADAERLFNRFTALKTKFMGIGKGVTKRSYVNKEILSGHNVDNWMGYWRGGSSKGTTFKNHTRKNLFTEGSGITDYPISIVGKKSVVLFFEDGPIENNEVWFVENLVENDDGILEIKAKVNKMVDGQIVEETYEGTQHINEFFKFIPPEDRGADKIEAICDMCGHKELKDTEELAISEMSEHIHTEHDVTEGTEGDFVTLKFQQAPKWNVASVFVFTDKNPPKAQKVPQWRFTFSEIDLNEVLKVYVARRPIKNLLRAWKDEPYEVYTQQSQRNMARLEPRTIYNVINRENLWTTELIDDSIEDILVSYGVGTLNNYQNMGWTDKLLNISLLDEEEELAKYNLATNSLESLRNVLLSKDKLPIWYIYKLFEVSMNPDILTKARNYRMRPEMIAKYNEYLGSITG